MFEWIYDPQAWISLATLTALEIVLGIDNIIFLTLLVGKAPPESRAKARFFGLALAMVTRIALLLSLAWVMTLTKPLLSAFGHDVSGRDLILLGGGLFLIWKSTSEIFESLEGEDDAEQDAKALGKAGLLSIILQIAIIDIVFSLDSVITAVGLAQHVPVMVIAIILAVIVMMFAAKSIGDFVEEHPSLKMLALSFLIMVGTALMAEGLGFHLPKGYIYFSMAFSLAVEMINIRMRKAHAKPVRLHKSIED